MAAGRNEVSQKVTLDASEHSKNLKKMRQKTRSEIDQINRSLEGLSSTYKKTQNETTKSTSNMIGKLKAFGKTVKENLGRGLLVGGAALGVKALNSSINKAIPAIVNFEKSFSRLAEKFGFSTKKAAEFQKQLAKIAVTAKTAPGLITGAAGEILQATGGDTERAAAGALLIGQAAKIGEENPQQLARDVIDILKSRSQEITRENIAELLQGAGAAVRGGDFKNIGQVLRAETALGGENVQRAGLTSRDFQQLLAASTATGQNREASVAAITAVVRKITDIRGGRQQLEGLLGGRITGEEGRFDARAFQKTLSDFSKGAGTELEKIKILQDAGLSEREAQGLFSIAKDLDKFKNRLAKTAKDTKTVAESFGQATDNLGDNLNQATLSIIERVQALTKPLVGVANELIKGNVGKAIGQVPGALSETLSEATESKALIAGGIALTALSGVLFKKLGIGGGLARKAGTLAGIAAGEIQPVFVTNASEIGSSSAANLTGSLVKSGAFDKILGKAKGIGAKAAPFLKGAGLVGLAGAAGFGIGTLIDKIQERFQGTTSEGFTGSPVERLIFKMDQLLGGENAAKIAAAAKIQIEFNDDRLGIRPRAGENPRSPGEL